MIVTEGGERIRGGGRVLDGEGARQRRIIEIWRANTYGRYNPA